MHSGRLAGQSFAEAHLSEQANPLSVSTQIPLLHSSSQVQGAPDAPFPRAPGTQQGTGASAVPWSSHRSPAAQS